MDPQVGPNNVAPASWRDWPRRAVAAPVRAYRLLLSPWLGNACRFEPTCSRYALQALDQHGALAGSYLMTTRLLRCHPWCEGGRDEVPAQRPRLFSHVLPQATRTSASADNTPQTSFSRPMP